MCRYERGGKADTTHAGGGPVKVGQTDLEVPAMEPVAEWPQAVEAGEAEGGFSATASEGAQPC